jgi:hypothetical protein
MIERAIARGFIVRMLTEDQITTVREKEASLPVNQCLELQQILALLGIQMNTTTLEIAEIFQMERCRADFYKTLLGPQQYYEQSIHPAFGSKYRIDLDAHRPPWDDRCKTMAQEMWQWEDYALRHYKPPAKGKSLAGDLGMTAVLMLLMIR